MENLLGSVLLLLLSAPAVHAAPKPTGKVSPVVVTSTVDGPSGPTTLSQTFTPKTYSEFIDLTSTITTSTVVTLGAHPHETTSVYTYQIGPGGIGWGVPTGESSAAVLLSPPAYLPGQQPSSKRAAAVDDLGPVPTTAPGFDYANDLENRAGGGGGSGKEVEIKKFKGCELTNGKAPILTRPGWPGASQDILDKDAVGQLKAEYSTISRYWRATMTGQPSVPTVTAVDAKAFKKGPVYTDRAGRVQQLDGVNSMDHAYEKSWLKDFFDQIIGKATEAGKLTCDDFNIFSFPMKKSPSKDQLNILQPVWDSLASLKNLDFIAMSQYINGPDGKGLFFAEPNQPLAEDFVHLRDYTITSDNKKWKWEKKGGQGRTVPHALNDMLEKFEPVLLGAVVMKTNPMLNLIDTTNNRIYKALLKIDTQIKDPEKNGITLSKDEIARWDTTFGKDGIAGAYKKYITTSVLPQINNPPKYLTNLWANKIKKGITASENLDDVKWKPKQQGKVEGKFYPEWKKFKALADSVDKVYFVSGSYTWEYSFTFTWKA